MKFRKKPIVIEAFQITKETRKYNSNWPSWLLDAWQLDQGKEGSLSPENYPDSDGTDQLQVVTSEGTMTVGWNDWIIQGIAGELYPCKPDIFEATYEEVHD